LNTAGTHLEAYTNPMGAMVCAYTAFEA